MTILQALKKIKHLDRKIKKNKERVARWCSYFSDEEPMYDAEGIKKLLQSANDLINERNVLRHRIHRTNIMVTAEFQGKAISLDELIILRTLTIPSMLDALGTMRRKEKNYRHDKEIKVVMQYDPSERDKLIDNLEYTMDVLDALLDDMNIKTELVE